MDGKQTTKAPFKIEVLDLKFENELGYLLIDSNNCWSKFEAQFKYLSSPPVCFMILSKPGLSEKSLGNKLAEYWNCVHINPDIVIQDQINLKSDCGRCIEFNLRCGNVITVDVILRLIGEVVKSDIVQHRGYVLSGIPLVETYKTDDCCRSLFSEEAFLIVEKLITDFILMLEFNNQRDEPDERESFKGNISAKNVFDLKKETKSVPIDAPINFSIKISGVIMLDRDFDFKIISIYDQIDILTKLSIPPTVLINISCPDEDVITLRAQNILLYPDGDIYQVPLAYGSFLKYNNYKCTGSENAISYHTLGYHCWRAFNFPHFVKSQLKKMNNRFKSAIKDYILLHNPQYVIQLDERQSLNTNFDIIKAKLSILPLFRVILPELVKDAWENDATNMEGLPPQEFLNTLEAKQLLAPRFPYSESLWRTKCPVALSKKQRVIGSPNNTVILFDHVFMLSSNTAMQTFCRNPRPFLNDKFLITTCRIAIVGTRKSGKSTLAKCLSWLFNCVVVDFLSIAQHIQSEKEDQVLNEARKEALSSLTQKLEEIWLEKETDRLTQVEQWKQGTLKTIERFANLTASEICELLLKVKSLPSPRDSKYVPKSSSKKAFIRESIPAKKSTSSMGSKALLSGNISTPTKLSSKQSFSEGLEWVMINVFSKVVDESTLREFCQNVLDNPDDLLAYTPLNIKNSAAKQIPSEEEILQLARKLIDEEDRYNKINVSNNEIVDKLIQKIRSFDERQRGWILDGVSYETVFWEALSENECLPDDVYVLTENTSINMETFILYKYRRRPERSLSGIFHKMEEPMLELHQSSSQFYRRASVISMISKIVADLLENDYFEENKLRYIPSDMTEESLQVLKTSEFNTFLQETEIFNLGYKNLKVFFDTSAIEPIELVTPNTWSPSELISEALKLLRYRYGVQCRAVSMIDSEVEEATLSNESNRIPKDLSEPKILGPSGIYCPVTLYKHSVIWKGREEFGQMYKQKAFYMISAEAQEEFVSDPDHFLNSDTPCKDIPPWRICVTGPIGSGKSTLAKSLAEKMGLIYVNFCDFTFSCMLQCPRENSRSFFNWLEELGISKIEDELYVMPSDFDQELKSQLKGYFVDASPLPANILNDVLSKLWFTEPFNKTGIVLDGFPCHSSDIDIVKEYFYIPDLIIEMQANYSQVKRRLFNLYCLEWKEQQKMRKEKYEIEKQSALVKWESVKNSLLNAYLIYLELENNVFVIIDTILNFPNASQIEDYNIQSAIEGESSAKGSSRAASEIVLQPEPSYARTDSNLSVGTRSEFSDLSQSTVLPFFEIPDEEIEYVTERVNIAYPEPQFGNEWESEENAFERIKARLVSWYESDLEKLATLKELCEAELFPWFQVESVSRIDRTLMNVERRIASEFKPRNESFFEQTRVVDMDLAELLLSKGFYFLSKFGVTCPVRVFEGKSLVQMFLQDKLNNNVFPVLHRQYIYYCSGDENLSKFRNDPLMYICSSKKDTIVHMPIKLAIIGPPKSGRTSLCQRFQEEFGISVWTRGGSIRFVLEEFPWTSLARQMHLILMKGERLPVNLIMQAVQLSCADVKSLTEGFVCDGFPQQTSDLTNLVGSAVFPYLILNLMCSEDICLEYLRTNPKYYNEIPRLSEHFLSHYYEDWDRKKDFFLVSIRESYQNLEIVDASWSKWNCWVEASKIFNVYMANIVRFLVNAPGTALPLGGLCITHSEFDQNASSLLDYCPTCLSKGFLRNSGDSLDRIGLLQWRSLMFWFCPEHYESFFTSPFAFELVLPDFLPKKTRVCSAIPFYENGRCIVTFADNYPTRKIVEGSQKFATVYKGVTYLFADEECQTRFMEEPAKYYDKVIHYEAEPPLAALEVSRLPVLGYLEQILSDIVIEATVYVATVRPKCPGLSSSTSAAIMLGLFLKCNNPRSSPEALEMFQKVKNDFEAKCNMVKECLDFMNVRENPFLVNPECCDVSDTFSTFSDVTVITAIPSKDFNSSRSGEMEERSNVP